MSEKKVYYFVKKEKEKDPVEYGRSIIYFRDDLIQSYSVVNPETGRVRAVRLEKIMKNDPTEKRAGIRKP